MGKTSHPASLHMQRHTALASRGKRSTQRLDSSNVHVAEETQRQVELFGPCPGNARIRHRLAQIRLRAGNLRLDRVGNWNSEEKTKGVQAGFGFCQNGVSQLVCNFCSFETIATRKTQSSLRARSVPPLFLREGQP